MRGFNLLAFSVKDSMRLIFLVLIKLSLFGQSVFAENYSIAVVAPQLRAPYSKVFDDMTSGISIRFDGKMHKVELTEKDSDQSLLKNINDIQPDAIICLGSTTLHKIKSLDLSIPIIAGAVVHNGDGVTGISMIPDGAMVMDILLELRPSVKQVYTLTYPQYPEQLVNEAREYLAEKGLQLREYHADSIQEAAVAYREMAGNIAEGDAIWILPGARFLDNAVFSRLLEVAWQKELAVFSSNPSHVGRGALFSIYPNNNQLGESLGELANHTLMSKQQVKGLKSLREVYVGVNVRTANHLGVDLNREQIGSSQLVVFSP